MNAAALLLALLLHPGHDMPPTWEPADIAGLHETTPDEYPGYAVAIVKRTSTTHEIVWYRREDGEQAFRGVIVQTGRDSFACNWWAARPSSEWQTQGQSTYRLASGALVCTGPYRETIRLSGRK